MEALIRMAFQETVLQKLRGWNTAIMSLERQYCGDAAASRADLGFQIEKLAAKRAAALLMLRELREPAPRVAAALQVSE